MTKKEMEQLADIVVSKIILELFGDQEQRQAAYEQFAQDHTTVEFVFPDMTSEEHLIGELARLQTILMIYEDKEEYEKAAKILKKLKNIQNKLGKL